MLSVELSRSNCSSCSCSSCKECSVRVEDDRLRWCNPASKDSTGKTSPSARPAQSPGATTAASAFRIPRSRQAASKSRADRSDPPLVACEMANHFPHFRAVEAPSPWPNLAVTASRQHTNSHQSVPLLAHLASLGQLPSATVWDVGSNDDHIRGCRPQGAVCTFRTPRAQAGPPIRGWVVGPVLRFSAHLLLDAVLPHGRSTTDRDLETVAEVGGKEDVRCSFRYGKPTRRSQLRLSTARR